MGTIRYADSAGSNTAPYDTWVKAATDPQTIIDLAVAGDENRYQGTFTLAAGLDIDTNAGDTTDGYVKHIGYNGSDVLDGTRCILDANGAAASCLQTFSQPYHWFENFEFKNATSYGVDLASGGDNLVFVNCEFDNNGSHGIQGNNASTNDRFFRCLFHTNTGSGAYYIGSFARFFLCVFYDNVIDGYNVQSRLYSIIIACVFHDNGASGDNGIGLIGQYGLIVSCVVDGEVTGIYLNADDITVLMSRITNNTTGLNNNSNLNIHGFNVYDTNGTDRANTTLLQALPLDGTADTNQDDPDADDGYNARGTNDFNLKASRTYNGDGTDVIGMNIGS